jgi:hypothetical protein
MRRYPADFVRAEPCCVAAGMAVVLRWCSDDGYPVGFAGTNRDGRPDHAWTVCVTCGMHRADCAYSYGLCWTVADAGDKVELSIDEWKTIGLYSVGSGFESLAPHQRSCD